MGSVLGGDGRARVCSAEHSSMSIPGAEAHLGEAASATLHGAGISSPRRQDASHRDGSALELRGGTTAASFAPVHFFEAKYGAWRPSPPQREIKTNDGRVEKAIIPAPASRVFRPQRPFVSSRFSSSGNEKPAKRSRLAKRNAPRLVAGRHCVHNTELEARVGTGVRRRLRRVEMRRHLRNREGQCLVCRKLWSYCEARLPLQFLRLRG